MTSASLGRSCAILSLALGLVLGTLLGPSPAGAANRKPAAITAKKVKHSTSTSAVTIRISKPRRATSVAVCLKHRTSSKRCLRYKRTTAKQVTFKRLTPHRGRDYVYQVRAYNRHGSSVSRWRGLNLRVDRAAAPRLTTARPTSLSYAWKRPKNANGYQVQLSSDRTFGTNVVTRTYRSKAKRSTGFTSLNGGMTYYARVRGLNDTKAGAWSPVTATKIAARPTRVSVMTYNLCGENKCRPPHANDAWFLNNVPVWTKRKPYAGSLARSGNADVIATQENATSTAFHTQLPGYARGSYKAAKALYYRASRFTALGGGWMTLDGQTSRYAVWNMLRDRSTGTAFIVVSAHLEPSKGATRDTRRFAQTRRLITKIDQINVHRLPVVYAGDWNSNSANADQARYPGGFDAPEKRFRAIAHRRALDLTDQVTNADLNSANQGIKAPKANADNIDAIYVPERGVTVESWTQLARFVTVDGARQYATPFPSDHNPIVARLVIATP